jgi:hypothetical protein
VAYYSVAHALKSKQPMHKLIPLPWDTRRAKVAQIPPDIAKEIEAKWLKQLNNG